MSLAGSNAVVNVLTARDTAAGDLGAYFTALTPTPGTGIIGHAVSTTLTETKAIFLCYNGGSATIYPLYLRMTMTVLPVGNVAQQYFQALDQGNRFASGGTALTISNTNMNSATLSGAQITVGAVVCSAPTGQRRSFSNKVFRPVIGVVGDTYQFSWGSGELVDPSAFAVDGTARANVYYCFAPMVVNPGCSFLIHTWGATYTTGATSEYEFGYVER